MAEAPMLHEKSPPDVVLDLKSFQLIRSGQPVKLEKIPMELLTLLVRRRGALVSREEIVRTIWGDGVHVDVDAGINTAIRKIRLALDDNSASPRYLETAVGKGYRFIGPIKLIDGLVSSSVVSEVVAQPTLAAASGQSHRWIGAALAVVALAAVILLAISAIHRSTASASGHVSGRQVIAVVPLQNISADPGQDYFVDGLTDEIITQLGQLNPAQLGVVKYRMSGTRQQTRPVTSDLGQAPGLQYLLEGSVQRQQEQARISVRLVRMADQTTLWTEHFDRQVGDVFSLQSEIAQRIGRELQVRVLGRAVRKPASPEVVEAYLHGRFELNQPDIREAARVYFERAIALDPAYAPAYAGLADFYRLRAVRDDESSQQAWQQSEKYANQALSLDADSVETHIALACIRLGRDWDWPAVREHAQRALQLNPSSPEAHQLYARYLRIAGNLAEDLNQRKQALALDPFRADLANQLTVEYFMTRDYQSAVASARRELEINPHNPYPHVSLCIDLGRLKRFDEALPECRQALAAVGHAEWVPDFMREYQKSGFEAATLLIARNQLNETRKRAHPDLWELANAYALAGMKKETLRTLFAGLPIHEPGLLQIRVDPDFDSIRDDPQYAELVRRIGFPTE